MPERCNVPALQRCPGRPGQGSSRSQSRSEPESRSGLERYIAALDHEMVASRELYESALSLYIARIEQALRVMWSWVAVADRAMQLIDP